MENSKIYAALIKAKTEFKPVIFDKVNPHFRNKFSSLIAINDATIEALAKNGLMAIQPWKHLDNGDTVVETILIHESGETIRSSCIVKSGKTDQQFGSSITYMRRYQLASVLGIVGEEDDDGEADQGRASPPIPIKQPETKAPAAQQTGMISEKQSKMLYAVTKDNIEYREVIKKRYGSFEKIPYADFQKLLNHFEEWKKNKEGSKPAIPEQKEEFLEEACPF